MPSPVSLLILALGLALGQAASDPPPAESEADSTRTDPPGMAWIPPGTFTMGSDRPEARPDERPAHLVRLDGFWIDVTEVTNAQFARFVEATGHRTTAERPIVWAELAAQLPPGTPAPPEESLQPGSMVFRVPPDPEDPTREAAGWRWVPGASWRHPEGPGSHIEDRMDHPVVHVSWEDAAAYAAWAGKSLPTEAQWERAARFGQGGRRFPWGDDLVPGGVHQANIWQGRFPFVDTGADGFTGTAPVGSFPPNAAGVADLSGNVWEWTADRYRADAYARRVSTSPTGQPPTNPTGPTEGLDPRMPHATRTHVQKGGSFLCHASYCSSYRSSARMSSTPDSGMSHLGFRCVMVREPDSSSTMAPSGAP